MDLTFSDDQQQLAALADRILAEQCPPETLRQLEREDDRMAADAWSALAHADLLGLALPEAHGGSGLGLVDAALVAEQVGRHVALVPYWTSTAAALTLARWGDEAQQATYLPAVARGDVSLAVAWWQSAELGSPEAPAVTASAGGSGYRLDGFKSPVPWASCAQALVVPARLAGGGPALFLVPADAPGVDYEHERAITGEPLQTLRFDGVQVEQAARLGGGGADDDAVVRWLDQRTTALLLATVLGVCEEALAITSRYVSERQQFGTPIGTFQAVAHRCADAYIDTEAIRLTTLQALWRLDAGMDAADALQVASFWACEGGQRVVHAAQHLHGGIGVDVDYPVHRYFRWAKLLELLLGGTNGALLGIGAQMVAKGS